MKDKRHRRKSFVFIKKNIPPKIDKGHPVIYNFLNIVIANARICF